ncbi:hypothetical protein V1522DRAFT_414108 [Lipomyces starkeyi]
MRHIAFNADSKELVQHFHELALQGTGEDNGKSGIRENHGHDYYRCLCLAPMDTMFRL